MLDTLSPIQLLLAALLIFGAYLMRGIAGFGSGLIAIPLLALMLPLTIVVPMVGLLDYLASTTHGVRHRQSIQWRELLPLLPFTFTGVLTALYLFQTLEGELLRSALGGFIVLYAFYSLLSAGPATHGSRLWAAPAGALGGLIGTLFGTGGPFYVIYLRLRQLDKGAFRATAATIFLIDGSSRIVGYFFSGFYQLDTMLLLAAALPVMVVGMYLGGHIHTTLSQRAFQQAIGVLLLGSGLALLLR
ncbi:MAG: sulfite exporter TauE/SafE family protein [Gammaproteobacteria bacterium]|nr:sulfite exporter TauE/SafE family protein [Gammaproteobacteria bacterium]